MHNSILQLKGSLILSSFLKTFAVISLPLWITCKPLSLNNKINTMLGNISSGSIVKFYFFSGTSFSTILAFDFISLRHLLFSRLY